MRWSPPRANKTSALFEAEFGVSSFRSLIPTQAPDRTVACADCFFTIGNAGMSPSGNRLFRVKGTLASHPITCLIDCGASHDFVSHSFIQKFKLTDQLLPSTRRVRGYDGQVAAAGGVFVAPLLLSCPEMPDGVIVDTTSRRAFLVAQLHSDDVILGMPWLAELDADIDFNQQTIHIPLSSKEKVQLPLLPRSTSLPNAAHSDLISSIMQLYADPTPNKQAQAEQQHALHELLSRTHEDGVADLALAYDDRGRIASPPLRRATQESQDSPEQVQMRSKLLEEFSDVFTDGLPAGLPPGRGHELHIQLTPGAKPPAGVPPRINQKHAVFESKWIGDMLQKRLISKSQSQFAAPHFYVDKPETPTTGEYRAVTDFRALNAVTVKNRYPLPRADQLFDKLSKAKYFTKIDLRTGFYQILINEADRHKTAFTTSQGLFQYNVLPMGLCNSPGVFMQLMNDTFAEFLNKFVLVFLDDIIVYSDTLEEHEQHVRQALTRLRQQRLYAKLSKSALCKREVEFLGHMVGEHGLRVMQDKIEAVRDWPIPTNLQELRAFLGLAGYYRRFVRDFSAIALPLTELTRSATRQKLDLSWGTKQQLAFVELKRALQSTPVLVLPDLSKEFVVHCDASGYAVGAVLQQDHGSGLQPIAFMSKKMVGAETRYPVHEQELLAIISALTTWRHYLEGATHTVRVRTDHKSLTHFQAQPMLSGRQRRWVETLSQFDYTIEYVKGQENLAADALSRRGDHRDAGAPEERPPQFVDPVSVTSQQSGRAFELNRILVLEDRSHAAEFNAIDAASRRRAGRQPELQRVAQRAAAIEAATKVIDLTEVSASTFSSDLADSFDKACRDDPAYAKDLADRRSEAPQDDPDVRAVVDEFIVRDGRLFHRTSGCLLVPASPALRTMLIRECHDSATGGHLGRDKTIDQMKRRFTWSRMDQDIELYVKTCEQCQRNKPSQQRTPGLLMPIAPPDSPGHTWTMDFIVNLPPCARTGNDCVIVFVCKLTKLKHYVACKTEVDAPTTARLFLSSVVRLHGMPERIISDRDPRFTAHFWQALWAGLGTTLSMSTAYHPQTDGQTENANKALEIMLRSVINFEQDDWEDHLPAAELATNNARNATTGLSPFYMFYGREARLPLDLALTPLTQARLNPSAAEALARWRAALVRAQETTKTAQKRQKKYADEHRRELSFVVGDRVLLATANLKLAGESKRARKFTERYIGPFRVKKVVNANAYELELPPGMKIHPTINISQLKEYHDGSAAFPNRPAPLTRPEPVAVTNDGAPEWEVERILDHRRYGRQKIMQYLILWKGYPVHEATWEPIETLDGALELVVNYNTRKKIQVNNAEALDFRDFTPVAHRKHCARAA
jgi:hypothetical protein